MTDPEFVKRSAKNTLPYEANYFRSNTACLTKFLFLFFLILIVPIFLCGMGLLVYLVFPPSPVDILVMGLDAREEEGFVSRTDSIMIVGVDASRFRISLLSIPRDVFIDAPDYGSQRINTINFLGEVERSGYGPVLLSAAINQSLNLKIDRYMRLNFRGFVELVDAVGGLTIDVERVIVDNAYPTGDGGIMSVRFESGVQHMDGERALIFARTRNADDDYRRAGRQQQVVASLGSKVSNPTHWPAVISVFNRAVDTDLDLWDMLMLVPPVLLNADNFDRLIIDRDYIVGTVDGNAILNYELLAPWLQEHFD